jgi:arginine/lysine/ornithine decarboxylase
LFDFRQAYDEDFRLSQVFRSLTDQFSVVYSGRTLRDLVQEMHDFLKDKKISSVMTDIFGGLPDQRMQPNEAYGCLVSGEVEEVPISHLAGRVAAVTVVPYPPGIPLVMPGEEFGTTGSPVLEYLEILQEFHNRFPGFEGEVHGTRVRKTESGYFMYSVDCVRR